MKRYKQIQSVHLKRIQSGQTIQDILDKIEEAHTSAEILQAYEIGTKTIKETTQKLGSSYFSLIDKTQDYLLIK